MTHNQILVAVCLFAEIALSRNPFHQAGFLINLVTAITERNNFALNFCGGNNGVSYSVTHRILNGHCGRVEARMAALARRRVVSIVDNIIIRGALGLRGRGFKAAGTISVLNVSGFSKPNGGFGFGLLAQLINGISLELRMSICLSISKEDIALLLIFCNIIQGINCVSLLR